MRILYILNGLGFSQGMPIGGADKRALEIGKRLEGRSGIEISVLTTPAGLEILEQNGWESESLVTNQPSFWSSSWFTSLLGRAISYLYLALFSYKVAPGDFDIIYPTSDFFFDLLPALRVKMKARWEGRTIKIVGIVHHFIDWPWKRSGSWLINTCLFLSQRFGFIIQGQFADLVLVADTDEGKKIAKILKRYGLGMERIGFFRNGVDYEAIERVPVPAKRYQACFLGGLRASKGIFDLVPIWKKVLARFPQAKLLVIGGGTKEYEAKLTSQIEESGLSGRIELAGVVPQEELFAKVKLAQVFISPSHEEGWGIVLCEAFACGLPVVCYDLPAFRIFKEGLVSVPLHDIDSFAVELIRILSDSYVRAELGKGARLEARHFGWDRAAQIEYDYLEKLLGEK